MLNFEYYNPARILFGKGEERQAGRQAARYSAKKRILLHYGSGSIKRNGVYDRVVASLKEEDIFFVELPGVVPNPRYSLAQKGIQLCRENDLDFILAVGGGSVIDSAKCIALGTHYQGDVWDYYLDNGKPVEHDVLGVGCVLTIPAAGSESSTGSVITREEGLLKRSYDGEVLIPKFSVLNPETTFTLPDYQTACGASDILAHLMERYFTQVPHVDVTDRLLEADMKTILYNAPVALREPDNYDVRAEIMWAGTIAHNNLLNTGRVGDWGSHNIEHELSGIYDIAHGAGLSIVFPAWMKYVYKDNIDKFVQFAVRVFDVQLPFEDKERIVWEGIRRLEAWYQSMGLPIRLSDANIPGDRLEEMAKKSVLHCEHVGHFKKLYAEDVHEILKLAL
ncbi:iron-containing alcohol dehydrogenase [Candidatus Soleaferrea massiliensis]|uniref:iron-containing alcohol dehydrogenase n=1 Tax=Candidatus Soleaferrea massiliensis TaxID=1470354 RepID=UPI00058BA9FA|nr:iron-containing alcohol dehydrogenase [Candidatus Soleaferrea massiliensis]